VSLNSIILIPSLYLCSRVDEPERSGAASRHLLFSRNVRSGTYCQNSRNAFYLAFRHLFCPYTKKGHSEFGGRNEIFLLDFQKGDLEIFTGRSGTSEFASTPLHLCSCIANTKRDVNRNSNNNNIDDVIIILQEPHLTARQPRWASTTL